MAGDPGSVLTWIGLLVAGLGLAAVAAGVALHRRDGWSVGGDGVVPPPRAVALGESALAGAFLAAGSMGLLQGIATLPSWERSLAPLVAVGYPVLLAATVALALVGVVALVGGAAWRRVIGRDG